MAKIKGWYYDRQMYSPLTSVTLHANQWWDKDNKKFINWDQIPETAEGGNGFGPNGNKCDLDYYESLIGADEDESLGLSKNACGYGIDPICTSILSEDFNIAITNTWSEFGGDPIGELWNQVRGPYSAVAKQLMEGINTLFENNKETMKSGELTGKFTNKFMKAIDFISKGRDKLVNQTALKEEMDIVSFLNKALVTNGTRFSYYGGTGLAFGNMVMKFTVFPKWENGEFIEVPAQVSKLYPYFIGQMESFEDATGIGAPQEGDDPSYWGMTKEALNKVFMFQRPPGGYLTEMNGIDKIQQGTLKIKIGGFYEISNLVCSDVMLNFSKNMVKNPSDSSLSPLFCDMSITLRPSTKYSDKMLKIFVGGSGPARNQMRKLMKQNVENEKKNIRGLINEGRYMVDQE